MPAVAWIVLTEAHVLASKLAGLVSAARNAVIGTGQPDPLPQALLNVSNRIRTAIADGGRVRLSATEGAIPPSLVSLAARAVVRDLQGAIDVLDALPLSKSDELQWKADERYLERLADGKGTVESPLDPENEPSVQSKVSRPRICDPVRRFTREDQDGI